jgi:hypothetical protein
MAGRRRLRLSFFPFKDEPFLFVPSRQLGAVFAASKTFGFAGANAVDWRQGHASSGL